MSVAPDLQHWLDRADALAAGGCYFDAHEQLETAWKAADGETKVLLQGLIQLAAGLHRLKLNPQKSAGAFYLLDRGLEKLRRERALLNAASLVALETLITEIRRESRAPSGLRFGLRVIRKD